MQLKYRIWDQHNKTWLDGHLFNIGCWFGNLQRNGSSGTVGGVIVETSCGVKDINGRPIYEGDIIKGDLFDDRLPTIGRVVFDDHFLFFANQNDAGNTALYRINHKEVIGNIHENHDLLPGV